MSEEELETTPTPEAPAKRPRRVSRRTAIKTGAAAAAGVAMAAYAKPSITTVPVVEAEILSRDDFPPCPPNCDPLKISTSVSKTISSYTIEGGQRYLNGTITITHEASQTWPAWVTSWTDYVFVRAGGGGWPTAAEAAAGNYWQMFTSTANSSDIDGLLYSGTQPGDSQTFTYKIPIPEPPIGSTTIGNRIALTIYQGQKDPYTDLGSIAASELAVISSVPVAEASSTQTTTP